jgi:hypothetical protein
MAITKNGSTPFFVNNDAVPSVSTFAETIIKTTGTSTGTLPTSVTLPSGYYRVVPIGTDFASATIGATTITSANKSLFLSGPATSVDLVYTNEPVNWSSSPDGRVIPSQRMFAATSDGSTYVASGSSGYLISSTDLNTWTSRTSQFDTADIYGLAFGNSTFVAAGYFARISSSTDGITWTTRGPVLGSGNFLCLAFANNLFIAGGTAGVLVTSTNGVSWTSRVSTFGGSNNDIFGIAFGNSTFLLTGRNNNIRTSTDAITWTTRTSPFTNSASTLIRSATFGNNIFLIANQAATQKLATSTDGITWTQRELPSAAQPISLGFGNGVFIVGGAVTPSGGLDGAILTSTDAITWTDRTNLLASSASTTPSGILFSTFVNNVFIASGYGNIIHKANSFTTLQQDSGIGLVQLPEASS